MNEAALAPVRVPAGRQGGPRTHCAAGWSRADCVQKDTESLHTSEDRPEGRSFSRRAASARSRCAGRPVRSCHGGACPGRACRCSRSRPCCSRTPPCRCTSSSRATGRCMRDCLDGDPRFGVVLIERGSEVGGGDERSALGTRGVITQAVELPDGRWVLEVEGRGPDRGGRVAARRPLPGRAGARAPAVPEPGAPVRSWAPPAQRVRRARALLAEQGGAPPLPPELALDGGGDAERARPGSSCAAAPLTAYDAQRLLAGRRRGAIAAPGRVDGGARARPAAHADRGMTRSEAATPRRRLHVATRRADEPGRNRQAGNGGHHGRARGGT